MSRADDEGLIVDWIGVQATGGGGASSIGGVGCVFALTAIRAAPYVAGRLLRRIRRRRAGARPGPAAEDRR